MNAILKSVFSANGSKFVGISFTKQDGSLRELNGVVKSVGKNILVNDVVNGGYRSVRPSSIRSVRVDGVVIFL